jgi:hypothetical protein
MTKVFISLTIGALLTGAAAFAQQHLTTAIVALVIGTLLASAAALKG